MPGKKRDSRNTLLFGKGSFHGPEFQIGKRLSQFFHLNISYSEVAQSKTGPRFGERKREQERDEEIYFTMENICHKLTKYNILECMVTITITITPV